MRLRSARSVGSSLFRRYHAAPPQFGRYDVLQSSSAMTSYPSPLAVPDHIVRPPYVPRNFFTAPWGEHEPGDALDQERHIAKLGGEEENGLRKVAGLAAEVLHHVGKLVKPGVTTAELDRAVHDMVIARGAYPSTLGYSKFPKSCTTAVNNVIAHGIPDDRPLLPEDIINIDLTLYFGSYHGDTSQTFVLSDVDKPGRDLVEATREALELGIRACGPGKQLRDIGSAIEGFAVSHGFSVNSQLAGHGIGKQFHQLPWIFHNRNTESGIMMPGDCFTIEPSFVQGSNTRGALWDDGWTLATETGARSAAFEHQVLITHDGVEVLTRRPEEER
ncbi:peptidase M24, structural domain-containing protein [Naematelia encephala]|uniref:Methionine aminopeptidase n=1 Tax=Naematelia encephala TaxID=71784 RepID=A0A1Y2AED3_9TREE|nr:peptidase M24, structural domain-containing protein [Naematelia encephala]